MFKGKGEVLVIKLVKLVIRFTILAGTIAALTPMYFYRALAH